MRTASKFIIPVLCSLALLLALCQPLTSSAASESEEVIVWTTEQTSSDQSQVLKAEMKERFGVDLKFEYFTPSDASTKINLKLASGDPWDIMLLSDISLYSDLIARGMAKDITQAVTVDHPHIYENMPSYAQDDMTYLDGKIYGIPHIDFANLPAIMVRTDILDALGFSYLYRSEEEGGQAGHITWEQLEELMQTVVTTRDLEIQDGRFTKVIPRMYGITSGMTTETGFFQAWSDSTWSVPWVSLGDEEAFVNHVGTSPQMIVYIAVMRYWFQQGYLHPAYFSMSSNDGLTQFANGSAPVRAGALMQDYILPNILPKVAYLYPPTGELGGGSGIVVAGFSKFVFNSSMSDAKYGKIMNMISWMATQEGYDRCNYGALGETYTLDEDGVVKYVNDQQFYGFTFYRSIKLKRIDVYMRQIPNLERQINEFKDETYPIRSAGMLSGSSLYSRMVANSYFQDRRDPAVNKYLLTEYATFVTTNVPLSGWQDVRLTYKGMITTFGLELYQDALELGFADEYQQDSELYEQIGASVFAHFNDLKSYANEKLDLFTEVMERIGEDPADIFASMGYEQQEDGTWAYTGPLKTEPADMNLRSSLITLFSLVGVIIVFFIVAMILTRKRVDRE